MTIWFLSEKKRKETRRELTDEEKEIMANGIFIGFLVGMIFGVLAEWAIIFVKVGIK